MPYTLQQYPPPTSQEGHGYPGSRIGTDGVSTIISQPANQPTYLPTHLPHHIPLHFAPPHHRHLPPHQSSHHHFPPSPPASGASSHSSASSMSSLSSPTLPPTSQTVPSLAPPAGYSLSSSVLSSSTTPPPRITPYGYSGDKGRLSAPTESDESEVYPLDLSIRSGSRQDSVGCQENGLGSRQRHTSRPGDVESSYKHHASSSSSSRTQHRLSPYSLPSGRSGSSTHSPSSLSRSPGPSRTDSPVYSRRRTPSPAYYPSLMTDGVYRPGVTAHLHQQHYLPPGPPPPPPPHLSPSPNLTVQSEHSSSPSPFQILTTADTVLHGAPIMSGLFKPYQDHGETNIPSVSGYPGKIERQAEEQSQHQSRDPRRQLLRQLQQQQQQQQQSHVHQRPPHRQQQDEDEERTYVDLDCPQAPSSSVYPDCPQAPGSSVYPGQPGDRSTHRAGEASSSQTASTETPMEVTVHPAGARGLNRQGSVGFGEENTRRAPERPDDTQQPADPFHQKSELMTKSHILQDTHHYLRQAFLSPSVQQQQRDMSDADKAQSHLSPHLQQEQQLQQQQQLSSSRLTQSNQLGQEGDESHHIPQQRHPQLHHHQQQHPEVDTTTTSSPSEVSMGGSTASDPSENGKIESNAENVSQEMLEEAKLMAFLSKTTLVTVKPNEQFNKPGSASDSPDDHHQKSLSSAHNIFKDFHVVTNDNNRPGKLPRIDFCMSATPRAGTPSSCKGSVIAPKKICFRLVDLVGLLVEQSLRA